MTHTTHKTRTNTRIMVTTTTTTTVVVGALLLLLTSWNDMMMKKMMMMIGTHGLQQSHTTKTTTTTTTTMKQITSRMSDLQAYREQSQPQQQQQQSQRHMSSLLLSSRHHHDNDEKPKRKRRCDPCAAFYDNDDDDDDDENKDLDMDRREALVAGLGSLWAITTTATTTTMGGGGTNFIIPSIFTAVLFPQAAMAGPEAKMELPNPMATMEARALNKQCLVESLGNRECLVYADDDGNRIYKGMDTYSPVLVERIQKASKALAGLPELALAKKWSQVTGVMSGPMGDLIRTMGQLVTAAEEAEATTASKAKGLVQAFKKDLYAIQAGVDRKDVDAVLKSHDQATNDLVAFLQAL